MLDSLYMHMQMPNDCSLLHFVARMGSQTPFRTESPNSSDPSRRLSSVSPLPLHHSNSPADRTRVSSLSGPLMESTVVSTLASFIHQPPFNLLTALPSVVPRREQWTKDEDVAACAVCGEHFSMVRNYMTECVKGHSTECVKGHSREECIQ